jgi:hypothetical protein
MKETDKVKIEEIVERLRQIQQPQDYKPDSKMCDYLDRSMYADYFRSYIRELVRAFEAEHAKMQLFVATGARVNCAIWGIMVGRNGAVKDFLIECTKITMVDFFCRISKGDLYVICNDTFRDAVLCNPALRQRFEEINDAIQEKVAQSP